MLRSFFSILIAILVSGPEKLAARPWDLRELQNYAMQHAMSPKIVSAQISLLQLQHDKAWGDFYPEVSFGSSLSTHVEGEEQRRLSRSSNISFSYTLKYPWDYSKFEDEHEISLLQKANLKSDVYLELNTKIQKKYLEVLFLSEKMKVAALIQGIKDKLHSFNSQLFQQGLMTRYDYERLNSSYAYHKSDRNVEKVKKDQSMQALLTMAGVKSWSEKDSLVGSLVPAHFGKGLLKRLELAGGKVDLKYRERFAVLAKQSETFLAQEQRGYLDFIPRPRVSLSKSITNGMVSDGTLSLSIGMSVGSVRESYYEFDLLKNKQQTLLYQREELLRGIQEENKKFEYEYLIWSEKLSLAARRFRDTENLVKYSAEDYKLGKMSFVKYTDALTSIAGEYVRCISEMNDFLGWVVNIAAAAQDENLLGDVLSSLPKSFTSQLSSLKNI